MWILIDNDDSFTHILWDYLRRFHAETRVINIHDGYLLDAIIQLNPTRIIISPGPGKPEDANLSKEVIAYYHNKIPILGICLGHQILGQFLGAKCLPSGTPLHGKTSHLQLLLPHPVFEKIADEDLQIMHYHSLIVSEYANTEIIPIAADHKGQLMAMAHPRFPILGMQFHPESILTLAGEKMIQNWANMDF